MKTLYTHYPLSNALELWVRSTPHKDIVTIMGITQVVQWTEYAPLMLDAWSELLDKGTVQHNKIQLAEAIESLGAHVQFSYSDGYLCWTAQCLKKDVATVYKWVSEMLFASAFPEEEIALWLKLTQSSVQEEKSDTSVQTWIGVLQALYPLGHPHRRHSTEEDSTWLASLDITVLREELKNIACNGMHVITVGDIDATVHKDVLSTWKIHSQSSDKLALPEILLGHDALRHHIEIPEKTSCDVRIVQALGLTKDHPDFWPLLVAVDALGGTFSARLMRTVRDVEGLTYGVNSKLHGLVGGLGGYFSTVITLAPINLEKGIASTLAQIQLWYDLGIEQEEFLSRKEGLLGRHAVRATTTVQIASHIRYGLMYDFGADYAEDYMHGIEAVSLEQVNAVIHKWIDPKRFIIVSSGTQDASAV